MAIRPVQGKTTTTVGLDTNILTDITLSKETPANAGFDQASTKASGIVKASNRFFKILMTQTGSNPIDKTEGTDFSTIFESGITDTEILFAIASEETDVALNQVKDYQDGANLPLDEQVSNAVIVKFDLDEESFELTIDINVFVASGEKTTLQLPSIVVN